MGTINSSLEFLIIPSFILSYNCSLSSSLYWSGELSSLPAVISCYSKIYSSNEFWWSISKLYPIIKWWTLIVLRASYLARFLLFIFYSGNGESISISRVGFLIIFKIDCLSFISLYEVNVCYSLNFFLGDNLSFLITYYCYVYCLSSYCKLIIFVVLSKSSETSFTANLSYSSSNVRGSFKGGTWLN